MNNRRLLIAAVFHFMHPVEKDSKKHHKLTKNSVSFNCRSKQSEHKNWTVVERDQRLTMVRKVKSLCLPCLYF